MTLKIHAPCVWLLLAIIVGSGCGSRTNRDVFVEEQEGTLTPHGRIDLSSVEDAADGVTYQTEDGQRWRVTMEARPDRGTVYGEPRPAKD
jgi:hypothetical protein